MNRAYINTVEDAVQEIGILAADKTVNELTEKDWTMVQNNILEIEANMSELIHLYDVFEILKKSKYY